MLKRNQRKFDGIMEEYRKFWVIEQLLNKNEEREFFFFFFINGIHIKHK